MGDKSKIEWTESTWNPVTGCTKISQGCKHCYAERDWSRLSANLKTIYHGRKFTDIQIHGHRLNEPLRWKEPRMVFVNSMSDLFHESVPDEFIQDVWLTMALAKRHQFQILTKRADRMHDFVTRHASQGELHGRQLPLSNVWLGVSCENQKNANARVPLLLETPAAIRFVSLEPLLGNVGLRPQADFSDGGHGRAWMGKDDGSSGHRRGIDWVIVGGETGPHARQMYPSWVRSIRDQCMHTETPFFFKQWGEWLPARDERGKLIEKNQKNKRTDCNGTFEIQMDRIGRAKAKRLGIGDLLDGKTWKEFPRGKRE